MTTLDQNRRIEELAIETDAAKMKVTPVGPISVEAVLVEALDDKDDRVAIERVLANGLPTDPAPWLDPPAWHPRTVEQTAPPATSRSDAA
jgi:hypothetical protein